MTRIAKLFSHGGSQTVRIPAAYRFDATEVYIRRDAETGDVVLSRRPADWDEFLQAVRSTDVPEDFLRDCTPD